MNAIKEYTKIGIYVATDGHCYYFSFFFLVLRNSHFILFSCSMEANLRQVTIIDELWNNEEVKAVRSFLSYTN